jgi:hypothetical protein
MIYLASPYSARRVIAPGVSCPDLDLQAFRADQAARCASRMMARGELVYCPIVYGHAIATSEGRPIGTDWSAWKQHSLWMLKRCEEVAVLCIHGWVESEGVQAELREARNPLTPIRYVGSDGETLAGPQ